MGSTRERGRGWEGERGRGEEGKRGGSPMSR